MNICEPGTLDLAPNQDAGTRVTDERSKNVLKGELTLPR